MKGVHDWLGFLLAIGSALVIAGSLSGAVYQHPKTGRWVQIIDGPERSRICVVAGGTLPVE